jgi:hypothetical protein
VNLQSVLDRDASEELDDVPDEVLMALIEAELPRYLLRRLRSKLPLLLVPVAIWAIASLGKGTSPKTASSEASRPASNSQVATTATPSSVPVPPVRAVASPSPTRVPAFTPTDAAGPAPDASIGASPSALQASLMPLTIVESGYSSAAGGTPLEQDPGNGALPIKSAVGQHVKRSFMRLAGTAQILHLDLDTSYPNSGGDTAAIDACAISQAWTAARGEALTKGPSFDATGCVSGQRQSDGSWIFDLSRLDGGPTRPDGIALVPTAGTTSTFDLAFSPATRS